MTTSKEKDLGHAAHSKTRLLADLRGEMPRPLRIAFIGAGSNFTSRITADIMRIQGKARGTLVLVDIDEDRLGRMKRLVEKVRDSLGATEDWIVEATLERSEALPGTDYIVNCIEVSGLACVRHDNDIPAKYGVNQCIGDTIGPGGLFKALRTGPVWLEILRDVERYCPQAIVLNYTNPMNMLCLAAFRTRSIPVVGLCHSVQGTSDLLAKYAGVPIDEMEWECSGINHLAWFTKLRHQGEDLYPRLFEKFRPEVEGKFRGRANEEETERDKDLVRKDMALNFGAFITESSGHLSEYLPYYRKRKDLIDHYMRERYDGETSFYANNWPEWRKTADVEREARINGSKELETERSWEYGSYIIEAREKNIPFRFHGNVYNRAGQSGGTLIPNLMEDGCVEVPILVDRNGLQPTRPGPLPAAMAAICESNMRMFDLGTTAIIEKSVEAAIESLYLDPLTSAVCSPSEIRKMALEMFEAEKEFLPGFE
ncbi:MAG: alpha-glucosidase/alpha-galactosidase [Puniceicoccales bacterium]